MRRAALGAGVTIGAALGLGATAQAANFTVTNTSDGFAPIPAGSLRQALTDAENGNAPTVDHILFQSGLTGTIDLSGAALGLGVTEPVEIDGPGAK